MFERGAGLEKWVLSTILRVRVRVNIVTTLPGNSMLLESYQVSQRDISIKDSKYIKYRESIHNMRMKL
jgi:hypothetical protein